MNQGGFYKSHDVYVLSVAFYMGSSIEGLSMKYVAGGYLPTRLFVSTGNP